MSGAGAKAVPSHGPDPNFKKIVGNACAKGARDFFGVRLGLNVSDWVLYCPIRLGGYEAITVLSQYNFYSFQSLDWYHFSN